MPAYNFKAEFAGAIVYGEKAQTIRKVRKNPTKVGQRIYLYTGMRTKHCRKLGEGEIISVEPFGILKDGTYLVGNLFHLGENSFDEDCTGELLAQADGFNSYSEFVKFFEDTYGLPFKGELIKWRLDE